jgi:hypothetical protein
VPSAGGALIAAAKGRDGQEVSHDDLATRDGEQTGARELGRPNELAAVLKKRNKQWLHVSKLARKAAKIGSYEDKFLEWTVGVRIVKPSLSDPGGVSVICDGSL